MSLVLEPTGLTPPTPTMPAVPKSSPVACDVTPISPDPVVVMFAQFDLTDDKEVKNTEKE